MAIIEALEGKPIDSGELEKIADNKLVLVVNESDFPPILLVHNTNMSHSQVILELTRTGYGGEPPKIGASAARVLLQPEDFADTGIKFPDSLDLTGKIEFEQWRAVGLEHDWALSGSIAGQRAFKYKAKALIIGQDPITEYLAKMKGYEVYARLFLTDSQLKKLPMFN